MLNVFMFCLVSALLLLLRPFYHSHRRSTGNYIPGRFGNRGDFSSPEEGDVNWMTGEGLLYNNKGSGTKVAADPYGGLRNPFINWLTGQVGKPGPSYEGELTAPMSDYENQSLDFLKKYGQQQGLGSTFAAGKGEIEKTLGGDYDPATSPYYQAVKAGAERNLSKTKANIASDAAGGGRFWTGARMKQQANADIDTTNALNSLLGSLSEKERQNRLAVLPQALQYGQEESNFPLKQASAFQTLGALPRNIKQSQDTALYNQFLKSQYDWPLSIASIISGVQSPPTYQQYDDPMLKIIEMMSKVAAVGAMGG